MTAEASPDELDIEDRAALERYLVVRGDCARGALAAHEVLAGGVSSRAVWAVFVDGRQWVLKQSLAKLRVAADWFSDPRRVHREALGMQVLGELAPPGAIPRLVFDDQQQHVLAMEAVPRPHDNWKSLLLAGRIEPDHVLQFAELLGTIHRASWLRREELAPRFADRTFFESLRLEPYYEYSAQREPAAVAFYTQLVADTRATHASLVHGDYSPKNVLVHAGRLVLLDHEVIHWGDPAFDVGFALTHLLSKAHHLPQQRAKLASLTQAWWERYVTVAAAAPTGNNQASESLAVSDERCARHALGCLLARVVGRSPLEYLSPAERDRQRQAILRLLDEPPRDVPKLIDSFLREIGR